jgi:lipopolysaccharide/colanic/teichoic acid biosynthesis glycosyltransferase
VVPGRRFKVENPNFLTGQGEIFIPRPTSSVANFHLAMETLTKAKSPVGIKLNPDRSSLARSKIADAIVYEQGENTLGLVVARYAGLESEIRWLKARILLMSLLRAGAYASAGVGKRLIDVAGATLFMIVLAPLFLLVAALIKLESGGPVLFPQIRIGKWGRPFTMYKFRSMCAGAEHRKKELLGQNEMHGGVIFKMKCDPRVTRIGKIIRRGSLDELPQLWNVLKGDMSLVGPRPPLPAEVSRYLLGERRRLDVKPGITCIWQVSGRSQLPFQRQVELDLAYIESQTMLGDFKLLLKTLPAVLLGRGAY